MKNKKFHLFTITEGMKFILKVPFTMHLYMNCLMERLSAMHLYLKNFVEQLFYMLNTMIFTIYMP